MQEKGRGASRSEQIVHYATKFIAACAADDKASPGHKNRTTKERNASWGALKKAVQLPP